MRRLSLVHRVNLVAIVAAALVATLVAVALVAIVSLRAADTRESHSKDVTVATLRVQAQLAEVESALRGYVLSENPRFLTLFHTARQRVPIDVAKLQMLVQNDPAQLHRADAAAAEISDYLTDYAQNVIGIAQISRSAARSTAANAEGKRRTDEIGHEIGAMLATEDSRARKESAHARTVANITVGVGVGALIIATALVLGFGAWVARRVAGPVRRVSAAAVDVAAGDLSVRLEEGGAAEVGALVSAFNSMTRSLEVGRHELIAQNDQLREAEQYKRDLISMVSHELRTPLSAVLGFTALLIERDFAPEERQRYLQIVDAQARRLAALAGDFLDVELLDGGGLTIVRHSFDLTELVREQSQLFFLDFGTHRLALDLPSDPVLIDGDHDRLSQVVGNLLSNAIKYSPAGSEVKVSVEVHEDEALVVVADDGIGIPAADRDRIFEKFFRTDEAASSVGGTGLGLAVAREIVLAHGGRIEVESSKDGGSTFVVTLPTEAPAPGSRIARPLP